MEKKQLPAKTCFSHIGGKLGNLLFALSLEKGWIHPSAKDSKQYYITEKGKQEFTRMGLDLTQIKEEVL